MTMKKHIFIPVIMLSLLATVSCQSSDDSEKILMGGQQKDTIASDLDQAFIPPTGPIEPLTEYIRPALTTGKRWIEEHSVDESGPFGDILKTFKKTRRIVGDTVVDGCNAKVMLTVSDAYYRDQTHIMREENGRVSCWQDHAYVKDNGTTARKKEWCLWYDVESHTVADSITESSVKVYPISRGTITLMNKQRRAVKVWVPYDHNQAKMSPYAIRYDYWVEGIGMLFPHEHNYSGIGSTPTGPDQIRLLQCWDGNEKIYDYREFSDDLYRSEEVFAAESDWPFWVDYINRH